MSSSRQSYESGTAHEDDHDIHNHTKLSSSPLPDPESLDAGVGDVGDYPEEQDEPRQNKDLEKGPSSPPTQSKHTDNTESNPDIVDWDGPNDPMNPRNWPLKKRWIVTITVSCFTLMSPLASSMVAPALPQISEEFHLQPGSVLEAMTLSIFILAYAIGPLFLGPLSELYGRQIVLQTSNLFFLAFNIACSRATSSTQLLVFRFFAGLGGSAPLAIGGGTTSDLFTPETRGLAISIYSMAPLTGPALGPVMGGFIAQYSTWRWVFYATSIADGAVQIAGFIFLRETYGPKILADKAKRLRRETGNQNLRTPFDRPDRTLPSVLAHGLMRPLVFLATEPIIQVLASYMAVIYGLMYLTLTTFASLWVSKYGEPEGIAGLHYLSLGIAFAIGAQIGSRALDRSYAYQKKRNGGVGTPEMRMPLMAVTSLLPVIGLIIFGWSAHYKVFWLVPDLGILIFGIGVIIAILSIQTYIIDNFPLHAASAIGAASGFRSLAGFGFPLFAHGMFDKLGQGWGNTLLALVALVFSPSAIIFYKYGPWLRARSNYAGGAKKH